MSKLEAGQMVMEQEPFDIEVLMHGVSSLVEAQIEKDGLTTTATGKISSTPPSWAAPSSCGRSW